MMSSSELQNSEQAVQIAVLRIAERIRAIAIEYYVPTGRGQLRKSIFVRSLGPLSAEVATNLAYARAVHDGRRAIVIRPKEAKALRFKYGGKKIFRKVVRQPARTGKPFFQQAINFFNTNVNAELASVLSGYPAAFVSDLGRSLKIKGIHVS